MSRRRWTQDSSEAARRHWQGSLCPRHQRQPRRQPLRRQRSESQRQRSQRQRPQRQGPLRQEARVTLLQVAWGRQGRAPHPPGAAAACLSLSTTRAIGSKLLKFGRESRLANIFATSWSGERASAPQQPLQRAGERTTARAQLAPACATRPTPHLCRRPPPGRASFLQPQPRRAKVATQTHGTMRPGGLTVLQLRERLGVLPP